MSLTTSAANGRSAPRRARPRTVLLIGTVALATWFAACGPLAAIDLDGILRIQQRDEAARDVKRARETVEQARSAATAARSRLDALLARHFESERRREPPTIDAPPSKAGSFRPIAEAELVRLKSQLEEMRTHRDVLLGYLTEEHPQVFYVDERIASLREQIARLAAASSSGREQARTSSEDAPKKWKEYADRVARENAADFVEYQELDAQWQTAQRALEDAFEAERKATERLETLMARDEPIEEQSPAAAPPSVPNVKTGARADAQESEIEPADSVSAASQPLALSALLIALAVAALAAVRLARSTADPTFASVDEVAAALAIPVVGIVPADAARPQSAGARRGHRGLVLVGQFLLAVVVFAAIALAVQNAGALWWLCSHPLEALDAIFENVRGG